MERMSADTLEGLTSSPERAYSCCSVCSTSCAQELTELRSYARHVLLAIDGTAVSSPT
jgi:hypothetical protein